MIVKLMAHRMRTQRIGEESVDREVFVFEGDIEEARKMMNQAEEIRKDAVRAGYPWPSRPLPNGYEPNIYDEYYLRIVE